MKMLLFIIIVPPLIFIGSYFSMKEAMNDANQWVSTHDMTLANTEIRSLSKGPFWYSKGIVVRATTTNGRIFWFHWNDVKEELPNGTYQNHEK